jgi:hypothetical protein
MRNAGVEEGKKSVQALEDCTRQVAVGETKVVSVQKSLILLGVQVLSVRSFEAYFLHHGYHCRTFRLREKLRDRHDNTWILWHLVNSLQSLEVTFRSCVEDVNELLVEFLGEGRER